MDAVTFDVEKTRALRKAHDEAKQAGKETFTFEGKVVLVRYAHYLLEYLEDKLRIKRS